MEINRYTVVFRGEIRDLDKNPFHIVSPFGDVVACGVGNEFSHADDLEEQIEALRAENAKLQQAMHDIYEIYAGSEGTAGMKHPELYLQGCVQEMAYIAGKHKRAGEKETEK